MTFFKIGRFVNVERTISKKRPVEIPQLIPELRRSTARPPRLKPKPNLNGRVKIFTKEEFECLKKAG